MKLVTARRVLIYLFAAAVEIPLGMYWYADLRWSAGWGKTWSPWLTLLGCAVVLGIFTRRKTTLEAAAFAAWQSLIGITLFFGLSPDAGRGFPGLNNLFILVVMVYLVLFPVTLVAAFAGNANAWGLATGRRKQR